MSNSETHRNISDLAIGHAAGICTPSRQTWERALLQHNILGLHFMCKTLKIKALAQHLQVPLSAHHDSVIEEKRNEHKTYILKNVDLARVQDMDSLKRVILDQFSCDIVNAKLKFQHWSLHIWIRTNADLTELLHLLQSKGATLWCDGVNQEAVPTSVKAKRGTITIDESSESEETQCQKSQQRKKRKTAYEERLERVDDTVDELRKKHGSKFSAIQYYVWAATISAGRHMDLEHPPRGSFRCGNKGKESSPSGLIQRSHHLQALLPVLLQPS